MYALQRAPSYQTQTLQEGEVIEEEGAIGEERPPHVPQRLRLVHTCTEKCKAQNRSRPSVCF